MSSAVLAKRTCCYDPRGPDWTDAAQHDHSFLWRGVDVDEPHAQAPSFAAGAAAAARVGHPCLERRRLQAESFWGASTPRIRQRAPSSTEGMCSRSTSTSRTLRWSRPSTPRATGSPQPAAGVDDHRALDDVAELPDVARPGGLLQRRHVSLLIVSMRLPNAVENSSTNRHTSSGISSSALAQRRHVDREDARR